MYLIRSYPNQCTGKIKLSYSLFSDSPLQLKRPSSARMKIKNLRGGGQASKVTKKPILAKFEGLFHTRTVFYHDFQQSYVRTWKWSSQLNKQPTRLKKNLKKFRLDRESNPGLCFFMFLFIRLGYLFNARIISPFISVSGVQNMSSFHIFPFKSNVNYFEHSDAKEANKVMG